MRPCYYINDPVAGRVLIPGCWGSAIYGKINCTCGIKRQKKELEEKVEELTIRIARLEGRQSK